MTRPFDLPEIEYAAPRWSHRLEFVAFQAFNTVLRWAPAPWSRGLVRGLAASIKPFIKKRISKQSQEAAEVLGVSLETATQIVSKSIDHFALNWLAQVAPKKVCRPGLERQEGFELLQRNQGEGRGTILLTMHFGLWEYTGASFKNEDQATAVIVAVQHNPLCDQVFNRCRSNGGFHQIVHNRLGVRHLLKYLKKGGSVAILSDVDIGKTGLCVPFLGKPASTPSWPVELAFRTDAKLLLTFNHMEDGIPVTTLLDMPDPRDFKDREHGAWELSSIINEAIGERIRQQPEQWFWMQRRWKTKIEKLKAPPQL